MNFFFIVVCLHNQYNAFDNVWNKKKKKRKKIAFILCFLVVGSNLVDCAEKVISSELVFELMESAQTEFLNSLIISNRYLSFLLLASIRQWQIQQHKLQYAKREQSQFVRCLLTIPNKLFSFVLCASYWNYCSCGSWKTFRKKRNDNRFRQCHQFVRSTRLLAHCATIKPRW